jgi:F-type H+-transporting ATPase subunit delta
VVKTLHELAELYAEALLDAAVAHNCEKEVVEDTALITVSFREAPLVYQRLCMPSISREEKKQVLTKAFGDHIGALTAQCINMMINRGRTALLVELSDAVGRIKHRREGVVAVEVESARDLDEHQRGIMERKVKSEFGESVMISYKKNPALLGGFQVRSPERLVDHSVRNGLKQLRMQLMQQ